jgi:DNA-directed RNA polymerase specialized sigma24 family protein
MKKAMRSEMALAGAAFDAGADPSDVTDASAEGGSEPRHFPERVSGTRLACAHKLEDDARVAALLRAHFRDVWRIVRRFGVPENCADDATQEVFIIAARRLSDIAPGSERPFLLASAVRVAANLRRSLGARRECPGDDSMPEGIDPCPNAEALLDQKRLRQMLDRVLDELSDDLRVAFVLYSPRAYGVRGERSSLVSRPSKPACARPEACDGSRSLAAARGRIHARAASLRGCR